MIYRDKDAGTVHKIRTLKVNLLEELRSLAIEESLFYQINKKTFTVKNDTHCIETIMPYLGKTLSALTALHGTEQWQVIKTQAVHLVKSLHKLGYVHGDISLDNFVLNSKNKLFLIDFETARKIKASNASVRLKLFSTDLRKHGVNPKRYTPADELRVLDEVFNEVGNEPCMAQDTADCHHGVR